MKRGERPPLSGPQPIIHGTGVIRRADGSIKAHFTFQGEAPLSREELLALGIQEDLSDVRNPNDEGPKRSV